MSKDRAIIASLVLALMLELALLLWHSGVFTLHDSSVDGKPAGHIAKVQNQLRRRAADSLVWENSGAEETVFYHDSVLTLKESTSVLELENQTEVRLSENTLITIEPPEDEHSGEIRLRFVRGDLGARNPYHAAKIQGDTWSISVQKGSDLEMRETKSGEVELRLKEGGAQVQTAAGLAPVHVDQIVRLGGASAQAWNLDSTLQWTDPPPRRIYVHGTSAPIAVNWVGHPKRLLMQSLGKSESEIELAPDRTQFLADLPLGHHRLYLRDGERTSEALDIQVWRAPLIHLLSPLPRNRVENRKPVTFLWQRVSESDRYVLNIVGGRSPVRSERTLNRDEVTFTQDEDLQWFVEGVDADGFHIPPAYRYPLYPRDNPFAAPKLRSPHLRAPANAKPPGKGAWLWDLLFPKAQAEELYEAEFGWEPVAGANQYVLEISETADFRDPTVNTTIKKETRFVWRGFRLQKYYWRVAAGHSRGRMGVFSEPETVDFSPLKRGDFAAVDGVMIRKIAQAPKPATESPDASAVTAPSDVTQESPSTPTKIEIPFTADRILLWQPKYSYMQVIGTDDATATLAGPSWTSLGLEWPWFDRKGALWLFDIGVTGYEFKPDPKDKYPFQPDLNWIEGEAHLIRFFSAVGLGFDVRRKLSLEREDYEVVRASDTLWFGVDLEKRFVLSRGQLAVRLSPLFSRDGQALSVAPEWRARIGPRFVTGVGVDTIFFLRVPDTGYSLEGFFTIGFPF